MDYRGNLSYLKDRTECQARSKFNPGEIMTVMNKIVEAGGKMLSDQLFHSSEMWEDYSDETHERCRKGAVAIFVAMANAMSDEQCSDLANVDDGAAHITEVAQWFRTALKKVVENDST